MPGYFIVGQCEEGLWDAFHDAEILRLEMDTAARRLEIDLQADFPCPPHGAASRIGLTLDEVSEWRFWTGEPAVRTGDGSDADIEWEYLPYSLSEFEAALVEDSPAYLAVAGVTLGPEVKFGFEISFVNLPLYVASVIDAKNSACHGRRETFVAGRVDGVGDCRLGGVVSELKTLTNASMDQKWTSP